MIVIFNLKGKYIQNISNFIYLTIKNPIKSRKFLENIDHRDDEQGFSNTSLIKS